MWWTQSVVKQLLRAAPLGFGGALINWGGKHHQPVVWALAGAITLCSLISFWWDALDGSLRPKIDKEWAARDSNPKPSD